MSANMKHIQEKHVSIVSKLNEALLLVKILSGGVGQPNFFTRTNSSGSGVDFDDPEVPMQLSIQVCTVITPRFTSVDDT